MARRQVSSGRKAEYYLGITVTVIGVIMFGLPFMVGAISMTGIFSEEIMGPSIGLAFFVAFIGFGLIVLGLVFSGIGKMGLAGSGVVLDPEKAREDVEPWARMTGGVVKDAVDEAGVDLSKLAGRNDDMPFDEKLRRLHKLYEDGLVTEQEYQAERTKILENA
jgi:hypothetical protein